MRYLRLSATSVAMLFCCVALLPAQSVPELQLAVMGDVPTPLTLHANDLAAMPRERVELSEADGGKTTYEGVALQEILKKAGVPFGREMRGKALAGYVLAEGKDGYAVLFSLGELDPILASPELSSLITGTVSHCSIIRGLFGLLLPTDKAGARSVRMLEKLEVVSLRK